MKSDKTNAEEIALDEGIQNSKTDSNSTLRMESLAYLSEEDAQRLSEFLSYSGIKHISTEYDQWNDAYDVTVSTKEFEKANNLYRIFCENELPENEEEDIPVPFVMSGSMYENATDKYKDNLSSSITFLICGVIGLVILILNDFGVIQLFEATGASFYLMNGVIGGMFVIFLIISINSFRYSKKIKVQAAIEQKTSEEMSSWLYENVPFDDIECSYDNDIPEEMKYFSRSSYIKNAIHENYPDLEEDMIDVICDRYMDELFPTGEQSEI